MEKQIFSYIKKYFSLRNFFLLPLAALIIVNIVVTGNKTYAQYQLRNSPSLEPGFQFSGLKKDLVDLRTVGYLTEKNISSENNDGQFMLAQYMLAPTVLDLNNPNHRYAILDCTRPETAAQLIKSLNGRVVSMTPFGKILIERGP